LFVLQAMMKQKSNENRLIRSSMIPKVRARCEEGHNYSTQALNSTEQAAEIVRRKMKEVSQVYQSDSY
jgi:hypothetical protein